MSRTLVVGGGSIGTRHATILDGMGHDVAFVSARTDLNRPTFADAASALAGFDPDYVVVATETGRHAAAVAGLTEAGYRGRLLVEKPLAVDAAALESFEAVGVGFNLRFHPVLARVAELLQGATVHTVEAYVGQHLSTWRPGREQSAVYSSSKSRGGGALRDMSHEFDYLGRLFGACEGVFALGGRIADVTEDSDDAWGIVARYEGAPVLTLQLNYLDTHSRRRIVVNSSAGTVEADFISGSVRHDGEAESVAVDANATYRAMHESMLAADGRVATVAEAATTDELILAIERSAASAEWVATR